MIFRSDLFVIYTVGKIANATLRYFKNVRSFQCQQIVLQNCRIQTEHLQS